MVIVFDIRFLSLSLFGRRLSHYGIDFLVIITPVSSRQYITLTCVFIRIKYKKRYEFSCNYFVNGPTQTLKCNMKYLSQMIILNKVYYHLRLESSKRTKKDNSE